VPSKVKRGEVSFPYLVFTLPANLTQTNMSELDTPKTRAARALVSFMGSKKAEDLKYSRLGLTRKSLLPPKQRNGLKITDLAQASLNLQVRNR
jgi:hypothetical protein